MAKKIARKKDSAVSSRSNAASLEHNVDRIRDILFGNTMQDYEDRFEIVQAQLDAVVERVDGDNKDLLENTKRQIAGIQQNLEEVVRDLSEKVNDAVRSQQKLEASFEKVLQSTIRESVTTLRKERQRDREDLDSIIEELQQVQEEQYEELTERKMDRQELVRLFMEFVNVNTGR